MSKSERLGAVVSIRESGTSTDIQVLLRPKQSRGLFLFSCLYTSSLDWFDFIFSSSAITLSHQWSNWSHCTPAAFIAACLHSFAVIRAASMADWLAASPHAAGNQPMASANRAVILLLAFVCFCTKSCAFSWYFISLLVWEVDFCPVGDY